MSIKSEIMKNLGTISQEEYLENINEDDEILAKTVEAEAKLLQSFANMMRDVKQLKWLLRPTMGIPYGSEDMDSLKDVMKSKMALEATRSRLKKVVDEKMPLLHRVIEDVLGPTEKEQEARDEMRPDHKKVVVVKKVEHDDDDHDEDDD